MKKAGHDQAGQKYWNDAWDAQPLPALWQVDSPRLRHHVERSFFSVISGASERSGRGDAIHLLVEVGCARSAVLPLFATKLGFQVSGIDYSPNGCEQARAILDREGVHGQIYCYDVFAIPEELIERFDLVVSFGLVEHFSDTTAIVTALARLLKPGGVIFTNIPNMNGLTGLTQRIMDRRIYDVHVPLTPTELQKAHVNAGLEVLECDYFISTNFGVVNLGSMRTPSAEWWVKKVCLAAMTRMSMAVWWWERTLGRLPTSRTFSPYVNCLGAKPR